MIIGIGTDLVKQSRVGESIQRFGDRFIERILTPQEAMDCRASANPVAFLSKRFAVKEAASKALGTGIGAHVGWHDIYVEHDELGAPLLKMTGKALAYGQNKGVVAMHLSISDEEDHALAFVVLSGVQST